MAFSICVFFIALLKAQKHLAVRIKGFRQTTKNGQLRSCTPHIEKAITDFYDYNRRYEIGDSKLEITNRTGNVFSVKVTIDTFEGAHNNYYTEILLFIITPSSVHLDNYTHTDFIK